MVVSLYYEIFAYVCMHGMFIYFIFMSSSVVYILLFQVCSSRAYIGWLMYVVVFTFCVSGPSIAATTRNTKTQHIYIYIYYHHHLFCLHFYLYFLLVCGVLFIFVEKKNTFRRVCFISSSLLLISYRNRGILHRIVS